MIVLLALAILVISCGGGNNTENGGTSTTPVPSNGLVNVYSNVKQKTPMMGVTVASKSGVSNQYLGWIDESMNELSSDITAQNRAHNINPSLVTIYALHDCVLSPESRTPSFLLRADSYNGTEYDQDPDPRIGKIFAAELVLPDRFGGMTNSWVICQSNDETYVKNASRYGYEHKFLYDFYRGEYEATKFHGSGVNHPLIPRR
jgi:hypothetical protein